MPKWLKRALIALPVLVLAAAVAAPFIGADRFRSTIHQRLERSLGRKVDIIGPVQFQLLPRTGFTAEEVVIHEDPEFGVEPFAYVSSIDLSLSVLELLRGRIELSGIRLVEPSVNLMKHPEGRWNFQAFLEHAIGGGGGAELPGIELSAGRLNFKFGEVKSVFYLANTDLVLDADSSDQRRFGIRIEGEPARTDRTLRGFGNLTGRGMLTLDRTKGSESSIELNLALERMSVSELITLLEGRSIGLGGLLTTRARLSGRLSNIQIEGRMQLDDFERFRWLLPRASNWALDYRGHLDLPGQEIGIETVAPPKTELPVSVRIHASQILSAPRWAALLELQDAPLASLRELSKELGVGLPRDWPIQGLLRGAVGFTEKGGVQGQLALEKASLEVPDLPPMKFESAELLLDGRQFTLRPTSLAIAGQQPLTVEATVNAESGARDVRMQSKGMGLSEFQSAWRSFIGSPPAPVLDRCQKGSWNGALHFRQKDQDTAGEWDGEIRLASLSCTIDGFAEALKIESGTAVIKPASVALTALTGTYGQIPFTASYGFDSNPRHPHRIALTVPQLQASALESLLAPAFQRNNGLFARTLRRAPPVPDWLRTRRLQGTVAAEVLNAGEYELENFKSQLFWDGTRLHLSNASANGSGGTLAGRLTVDMAGSQPAYEGHLELTDIDWKDGKVTAEADLTAAGRGEALLASLNVSGSFHARDLSLGPDSDWRTASGCFLFTAPRLQLIALQATNSSGTYQGQGTATAEGRLIVELADLQRQLRVTGKLTGLHLDFSR